MSIIIKKFLGLLVIISLLGLFFTACEESDSSNNKYECNTKIIFKNESSSFVIVNSKGAKVKNYQVFLFKDEKEELNINTLLSLGQTDDQSGYLNAIKSNFSFTPESTSINIIYYNHTEKGTCNTNDIDPNMFGPETWYGDEIFIVTLK